MCVQVLDCSWNIEFKESPHRVCVPNVPSCSKALEHVMLNEFGVWALTPMGASVCFYCIIIIRLEIFNSREEKGIEMFQGVGK